MKQTKQLILGALMLSCLLGSAAESSQVKPEMTGQDKISTIRLVAAAMPGKALKDWMTQGAWNRWQAVFGGLIEPDEASPILSDFFTHAILLTGPQSAQTGTGIYAFYNPLQDTILLFQTDNQEQIPRLENFAFLTGSDFRGETLKEKEYPQAIAPVNGDLDAVLLKNIAAVSRIFHTEFPDGAASFSLTKYRAFSDDADKVSSNAALRLALLERLTRDEADPDLLQAAEIALILWKGDAEKIGNSFTFAEDDAVSAGAFSALPERVRKSVVPVLYFKEKGKKEALFGFASHLMPEVLILVRTSAEPGGKPLFIFLPLTEKFALTNAETKAE